MVTITCVNVSNATDDPHRGGTATIAGTGKSTCDPGETLQPRRHLHRHDDGWAGQRIPGDPLDFQVSGPELDDRVVPRDEQLRWPHPEQLRRQRGRGEAPPSARHLDQATVGYGDLALDRAA